MSQREPSATPADRVEMQPQYGRTCCEFMKNSYLPPYGFPDQKAARGEAISGEK
jgi:hypothetical protein